MTSSSPWWTFEVIRSDWALPLQSRSACTGKRCTKPFSEKTDKPVAWNPRTPGRWRPFEARSVAIFAVIRRKPDRSYRMPPDGAHASPEGVRSLPRHSGPRDRLTLRVGLAAPKSFPPRPNRANRVETWTYCPYDRRASIHDGCAWAADEALRSGESSDSASRIAHFACVSLHAFFAFVPRSPPGDVEASAPNSLSRQKNAKFSCMHKCLNHPMDEFAGTSCRKGT